MAVRMVRIDGTRIGPRLVCDQCLAVIESTSEGSAEWRSSASPDGSEVFFTHHACTRAFRAARGGQAGWEWARLEDFHFWLAKNLGMKVEVLEGTPLRPYQVHGQLLDPGTADSVS